MSYADDKPRFSSSYNKKIYIYSTIGLTLLIGTFVFMSTRQNCTAIVASSNIFMKFSFNAYSRKAACQKAMSMCSYYADRKDCKIID